MAWSRARPGDASATRAAGGPTGPSDSVLVAAAQADRQAFAPLYDRYLDPVYRYCLRRLGSREAAEDATGQVFAKALAALPGYRDRSFRGWLFTIAHNVVGDAFRRPPPDAPWRRRPTSPTRRPRPRRRRSSPTRGARCGRCSRTCRPISDGSWSCAWPGSPAWRSPARWAAARAR